MNKHIKSFILLISFIGINNVSYSQSADKNYVKSTVYKEPVQEENIEIVPNSEKSQTINYVDGLGRPMQSIQVDASANGNDIIQHIEYDELGRVKKEYLPYVKNQGLNAGNYIEQSLAKSQLESFYNDSNKVSETTNFPFSEKVFDGSPLNKVIEQGAPGFDWQIKVDGSGNSNQIGHTIKIEEVTNQANKIILWGVDGNNLVNNGFYDANQLWITIIKNENWIDRSQEYEPLNRLNTTEEYKDKLGRVVLKRTFVELGEGDVTTLSTYYVYDVYGNLRYVIPPLASKSPSTVNNNLAELCYQYKYDAKNRLIEKQIPGKGKESIVYDNADRPILIQDTSLVLKGEWLFTKYDALGRVILTGLYKLDQQEDRASLQQYANLEETIWEERDGSSIGYTITHFPKLKYDSGQQQGSDGELFEIYTKNYYDDYNFVDTDKSMAPTEVYGQEITTRTRGLVTSSWIKVLDGTDSKWNKSYTYYDEKARVIQTISKNWQGGNNVVSMKLNFIGEVLETSAKHLKSESVLEKNAIQIVDRFDYDHAGRLLKQNQELSQIDHNELVGVTIDNSGIIKKTSSDGYGNAGGSSSNTFTKDGFVEWEIKGTNRYLLGFSDTNINEHYNTINYCLYVSNSKYVSVYENGIGKGTIHTSYVDGDKLRIERKSGVVRYYVNDLLKYTSFATSTTPMVLDYSIYYTNNTIQPIKFGTKVDLVENQYSELGELKTKKVGNELQTVDYKYNIRGWLTQINDPNKLGDDKFAFKLGYNSTSTPLYNGNIAETTWKTANIDTLLKSYTYTYDGLNRLKKAISNNGRYDVSGISYDVNGNIKTLSRTGKYIFESGPEEGESSGVSQTRYGSIDVLNYTYIGNKLVDVVENGLTGSNYDSDEVGYVYDISGFKCLPHQEHVDYEYDENGNLVKDNNKGINKISYNHLNLPSKIEIGTNSYIEYIYDASGVKLQKQLIKAVSDTVTVDYLGAFQYENDTLQFISQPEGYIYKDATGYRYVYQYKDHLGNNRLSFMKNNGIATIVDESNYYPFGLTHKGYNNITNGLGSASAKKYKYNGKELQDEIGLDMYDYGARHYDPSLGRWFVVDPLADQMRRHSPYNYAFDNPIYFIDADGMMSSPFDKSPSKSPIEESMDNNIYDNGGDDDKTNFILKFNDGRRTDIAGGEGEPDGGKSNNGVGLKVENLSIFNTTYSLTNMVLINFTLSGQGLYKTTRGVISPLASLTKLTTQATFYSNASKAIKIGSGATLGIGIGLDAIRFAEGQISLAEFGGNSFMNIAISYTAKFSLRANIPLTLLYIGIQNYYPGGIKGYSNDVTKMEEDALESQGAPWILNKL